MESDAYKLGYLDAALAYGLTKESWAKAVLPAAGALMGAIAAPEGETAQGAALGGLGALGLQSAALAGAKHLGGAPAPHVPVPPTGGTTVLPKGAPVPVHAIPPMIHETAQQHNVDPQELHARRMQQVAERPAPQAPTQAVIDASKHFGTDPAQVMAMNAAPGPMQGAPMLQAPAPAAPAAKEKAPKKKEEKGRKKKAELADFKIAVDVSAGVGIPGLAGVSMGLKDQRERLPGMSRWVPRSTIERGFDYTDEGIDPEAVTELESERGTVAHPLLGAALAAAGARKFLPQSGVLGPLLGGLVGGGLGTLYNQATKNRRIEEGLEAHSGAQREREKFPLRRHPTQTANESTPLAVSRGSGDA